MKALLKANSVAWWHSLDVCCQNARAVRRTPHPEGAPGGAACGALSSAVLEDPSSAGRRFPCMPCLDCGSSRAPGPTWSRTMQMTDSRIAHGFADERLETTPDVHAWGGCISR